jgi:hypothetical protein
MTDGERWFRELLEGLSELQLRELCIQAVRKIRRTGDRASTGVLDPSTFQRELVPILRQHRNEPAGSRGNVASLETHFDESWVVPLLEFFVWMQRTGLAVARANNRYRLLPAGLAFFDGAGDDHPLVPGWAERLRRRCPTLPDDVLELLTDAHACFEHGLLRPTVALLGVSFESTAIAVHDALLAAAIATTPITPRGAAQRINAIRSALPARFPGTSGPALEARGAATRACDFADHLRTRRNDASHPVAQFPFDDRQEVEELLLLASRNLPGLWAVA